MASPFYTFSSFLSYRLRALGAHSLHSPFLFALYNEVVGKSNQLNTNLEKKRHELKKSNEVIDVIDFKTGRVRRTTVGHVARQSLSQPRFSNFLSVLCSHLNVNTVLETGTSLGVNSLYLAEAKTVEKVVSLEGSEIIHMIARKVTKDNGKIKLELGNLYDLLEINLAKHQPDFIFLDADHRSSAIEFCLEKIENQVPHVKCIVVHDIYWSKDMTDQWERIKGDPKYPLTVDIFQAGLIFPNLAMEKQHFTLKF